MKRSTKVQHQGAKVSGSGKKPAPSDPSHPSSELRTPTLNPDAAPRTLLTDVRELIVSTRQTVARGVNAALLLLYWKVGERIRRDVLKEKRAEYGEEIVSTLSAQLVPDFGAGFALRNLRRMIQFSEVFPDPKIVSALSTQLGWSHFVELLPLKKHLQREFYAEMCRVERWLCSSARRLAL